MTEKHALLIGNGEYEDKQIPNLTKPRQNIADFEKLLIDPAVCGFDTKNVKTLGDHPKTSVEKAIARFFAQSSRNDLRLLYFTGHGFLDKRGELYFAVQDTEREMLSVSAVSASFIAKEIANNRAKNQIIILDCCYSGAFKSLVDGAAGSNVVVLTASDATEFAWENEESLGDPPHSVFTHHLIYGLKTGDADGDTDGWVSVTELYEYAHKQMAGSKQKPICHYPFSRQEGKILLARTPPSPARVPQELLDGHYFVSYSPIDGEAFALELYDALDERQVPVWMDRKNAEKSGPAREDQIVKAIETCAGLLFVGTAGSLRSNAACWAEWRRALKYKKPVIPVILDPGLDTPDRLSGRRKIKFPGGDVAAHVDQLHQHLKWMATPEGRLQMLKDRQTDAERDLQMTDDAVGQKRILEDIEQLDKEIKLQEKIAADPEAAGQQVEESIERGLERERKPEKPEAKACKIEVCARYVNPPPATAPAWFQDRHVETKLVADFLKDPGRTLLTVSGRGGIGKTAMICRVLHALEQGVLPDDLGPFPVRGIVYLSAVGSRKIMVPNLFADLCSLLPEETAQKLDGLYRDPQAATERKMAALLDEFPPVRNETGANDHLAGPVLLLLDNFEDVVDAETRKIKDAELDEALHALLTHPPHAVKVIITTRIVPKDLPIQRPERYMPLPLDEGLASPYAEQILREMDAGGGIGLKDAPEKLLKEAANRTRGYPRALEALFAILSADRDTSLEEILADAEKMLPENVVEALVGEAFNRLDERAQKVIQGLAIYSRPVTPTALDFLLKPYLPGIDTAPVLNRLVNMQFVRKEGGRYYLHPVDREYAMARIPEGEAGDKAKKESDTPFTHYALNHRGAEYYKQARLPRAEWKTLEDLKPQLAEFDLRYAGEDYDTAARVLRSIDFKCLLLWGYYRLMIELHEKLQGRIGDLSLKEDCTGNLGTAYASISQIQKAIECHNQALSMARESKSRSGEAVWLGNLGACYSDLGQTAKAIEYYEQALKIAREIGYRQGEAGLLGNLGLCYSALGQPAKAIEYHEQALKIAREIGYRQGEAIHLGNLGNCYSDLGQTAKAIEYHEQALKIDREIGYRQGEAGDFDNLGNCYLDLGQTQKAIQHLVKAIKITDEIGFVAWQNEIRNDLAYAYLFSDDIPNAKTTAKTAQSFDFPQNNHNISVLVGLIALRQNDVPSARQTFEKAISQADQILNQTPQYFEALDAKALSLSGLALCEQDDPQEYITSAKQAYEKAREINSDLGYVRRTLRLFDTLAVMDKNNLLAEVRKAAEGSSASTQTESQG